MAQNGEQSCGDLSNRISKNDLFACLALWMEKSPLITSSSTNDQQQAPDSSKERKRTNAIGVVIVDSTETVVSVECTRGFLHGVQSALIDSHGRLKGSVIFASRKPCACCTKLIISAGVSRVFYLPFEPENPNEADMNCVDKLFQTSPVAQSIYLPSIEETTVQICRAKQSPYANANHKQFTENDNWGEKVSSSLLEYETSKNEIDKKIFNMIKWIDGVTFGDVPGNMTFHTDYCRRDPNRPRTSTEEWPTKPEPRNENWQKLALHLSRMAQMLSQRSDDPKRGVGAVITKQNQIVAVGWNGYLPNTQPGDFPTASHHDNACLEKTKYPFSVHAEQSAILRRNTREIGHCSTTIFVSKKPCDECVPLLLKTGIQNAVYPRPARKRPINNCLTYHLIRKCIRKEEIRGFKSTQSNGTNAAANSDIEDNRTTRYARRKRN